jgi:hypothetical protein
MWLTLSFPLHFVIRPAMAGSKFEFSPTQRIKPIKRSQRIKRSDTAGSKFLLYSHPDINNPRPELVEGHPR